MELTKNSRKREKEVKTPAQDTQANDEDRTQTRSVHSNA